ncbi:hypothetical protein BAUCODRAFT_145693 [Baudoinia panamericana UAMH 10762]|uniref:Life-span regulatory factor domain-containing protein n=1 Tax=Baudoinia panamericana (strain UAMH 10762) TaxID=717646 RepID=M2LVH2_BAUPA|nr:uncharacterized protein BAUCODRAFT_145693 [Baudoinia panamericana UAMH 10762]EMC98637.1 hypothetical protein BAUCODRAFT_145693 [Baudoinia panamericana UAMH 10762]
MASFLQFCPTCEKQIVTPGHSILYCSEACRKKDVSGYSNLHPTASPPTTPSPLNFDTSLSDIVPQRSPTVVRPLSLTFSDMDMNDSAPPGGDYGDMYSRRDSEATHYLAQLYSTTWNGAQQSSSRPAIVRANTASELPSLVHSASSSVGTTASINHPRPKPSRHNKSYSISSTNSIDLVSPYIATAPSSPTDLMGDASVKSAASTVTAFRVAQEGEFEYGGPPSERKTSQAASSLKQLFYHDAMKAPPSRANPSATQSGL